MAYNSKSKKRRQAEARKEPGGSNVGKYPNVSKFAGPAGGAPKGSYPINTKERAKSALKLAHNAPNPSGIKKAVYKAYPSLDPKKKKKEK
jgi:hypothetical protein